MVSKVYISILLASLTGMYFISSNISSFYLACLAHQHLLVGSLAFTGRKARGLMRRPLESKLSELNAETLFHMSICRVDLMGLKKFHPD